LNIIVDMPDRPKILVCSCDDTMPLDSRALRRGCQGLDIVTGRQFCRAELERVCALARSGAPLTIGCTQEAPVFREVAAATSTEMHFFNLRESAGWSSDTANAGPKMAALAAAATVPMPEVSFVRIESAGAALVYGRDEQAIEAATLLKEQLAVTALIARPGEIVPPRRTDFPIAKGIVRSIKGHLGGFELTVDDYALPVPSSRGSLVFGPSRNRATSRCDVVLDLSGSPPLFPSPESRDGYVRADPGDPVAVLKAVLRARDLTGSFDKPRYVDFTAELCAHSRSGIVGCHRCLDLCPTSAIAPVGDHVTIDDKICAGCGQCAAACPTGAASYALPPADVLLRKLRTLLTAYREAGGTLPVLLLHDEEHGAALIEALARHGDGLPANVLPFTVNEVTQIGLEVLAAAFAYGAAAVRILMRAKPRHDPAALHQTVATAEAVLAGVGLQGTRVAAIQTDDPFALGDGLREIEAGEPVACSASFEPAGGKRDLLRFALAELHRVAPRRPDIVDLPAGAPFGAVEAGDGCTLCLACVSACPTGALSDDPDRPVLRFAEDACVQCGLCKATCPEKVVRLVPRLAFAAIGTSRVLHEEEPFSCIRCGKPFGVKSTIDRIMAKLEDRHWMYRDAPQRLDLIKMCEDCRAVAITQEGFDPHAAPVRPRVRTTDDYLQERETKRDG
jgi:ferredoxin